MDCRKSAFHLNIIEMAVPMPLCEHSFGCDIKSYIIFVRTNVFRIQLNYQCEDYTPCRVCTAVPLTVCSSVFSKICRNKKRTTWYPDLSFNLSLFNHEFTCCRANTVHFSDAGLYPSEFIETIRNNSAVFLIGITRTLLS